ncbi:MAG TPA: FAD:protein FMN transferase [Bacteroidota bacterium]
MNDVERTRRMFLGRATRAGLGIVLLQSIPPWAIGRMRHTKAYRERSFFSMGSVATVCAYGESTKQIDHAVNKVIAEFGRLDRMLSVFDSASEISRINSAAGREPVSVSDEVCDLLGEARRWTERTSGQFDITVGPLMELWGFRGTLPGEIPPDSAIRRVLEAVGVRHLVIDRRNRMAGLDHRDSKLDLGGIGVGYAIDRAVGILKSEGIENAFLNHSGDAFALGKPDDQNGWIAAIPDPDKPSAALHDLCLSDCAVSTSAAYERFVKVGAERYGHVMDVQLGRPGRSGGSVTVVAGGAETADALSTAAFSRGEPVRLLDNVGGTSYFIVQRDGGGNWKINGNTQKREQQ